MKVLTLLSASVLLALAGCSSAPVHYHTLLAPQASVSDATIKAPFLLNVLPVGIPAQLDQTYLVVRQGQNGVTILDNERWASAFGDEVRSALSAQLTQQLASRDIAGLPAPGPKGKPVMMVKVQIRRFDAWPNRDVQLDASWSLGVFGDPENGDGNHGMNAHRLGHASLTEAAPGGYAALVNAQQDVLRQLAGKISSEAKEWSANAYQ